jgi:hypothetical protein
MIGDNGDFASSRSTDCPVEEKRQGLPAERWRYVTSPCDELYNRVPASTNEFWMVIP